MQDLTDILNWRRINELITTSGQPTECQLAELQRSGVTCIVNLGIHNVGKGALADEPSCVALLGMDYINIPVDFENPTELDYEAFKSTLFEHANKRVHVHCIYNARVSAFFYRYALDGYCMPVEDAAELLDSIWRPGEQWSELIINPEALGEPNKYAGKDYVFASSSRRIK